MNMLGKTATILILLLTLLSVSATAIDLVVEEVEIDDTVLQQNEVNRLELERNDLIEVEVLVRALNDTDDADLEIFLSGFEFGDFQPVRDAVHTFDLDEGNRRRFRLKLPLPEDLEEDNYKMRLIISDRDGDEIFQNFNLRIDRPRHVLKVEDVIFSPAGEVQAGSALLTVVRVENQGEEDEDDVKVEVSIPELGISGVDFIDEIDEGQDEEEETEEIFIRVPLCTPSGTYDVDVEVSYDEGFEKARAKSAINVIANPRCEQLKQAEENNDQVTVVVEQPPAAEGDAQEWEEGYSAKSTLRRALEVMLIILVGLLVVVALLIGFNKFSKKDEDEF